MLETSLVLKSLYYALGTKEKAEMLPVCSLLLYGHCSDFEISSYPLCMQGVQYGTTWKTQRPPFALKQREQTARQHLCGSSTFRLGQRASPSLTSMEWNVRLWLIDSLQSWDWSVLAKPPRFLLAPVCWGSLKTAPPHRFTCLPTPNRTLNIPQWEFHPTC